MKIYSLIKTSQDLQYVLLKLEDLRNILSAQRKSNSLTEKKLNDRLLKHVNDASINFISLNDFLIEAENCSSEIELEKLLKEEAVF